VKGDRLGMSRLRVVLMVVGVVAAFSSLSVASASAGWLVNGTSLGDGSAALSTQALVDSFTTLLVPALTLSIQCKGHFLDGVAPQIFGLDRGFASSLTFLECQTVTPAKCELVKGTSGESVKTVPILALASKGKGESVNVNFKPETKTTFANLEFSEANTCAMNGFNSVTGSVVVNAPTGQLSLLAQALIDLGSSEGNNSLKFDNQPAFLDGGKALLTLASDSKWSFD
jgi:hypothetical protein